MQFLDIVLCFELSSFFIDKLAKYAHLRLLMSFEVKTKLATVPNLQQIIVQGLFTYSNQFRRILQSVLDEVFDTLLVDLDDARVKVSPLRDFLDYVFKRALLRTLLRFHNLAHKALNALKLININLSAFGCWRSLVVVVLDEVVVVLTLA